MQGKEGQCELHERGSQNFVKQVNVKKEKKIVNKVAVEKDEIS